VKSRFRSEHIFIPLLFITGLIAWGDRVNMSIAAPHIMEEFSWGADVMGLVFSAFGWGYLLAQLWTGWLSDRWGGIKTLTAAMTGWSLATLLTVLPRSAGLMGLVRGLLGVCESAYGPAQAAVITHSFPPDHVPRALTVCISATALGPVVAVPLASTIVATSGWRMVFLVFGAFGLIWAGVLFLLARWVRGPLTPGVASSGRSKEIPLLDVLRRRPVWGLGLAYLPNTFTYYFVANWMPTYLITARGFTLLESGFYTALPFLCTFLLEGSTGWISNGLMDRGWSRTWARKIILYVGSTGVVGCLLLAGSTSSPALAVVGISAAMGLVGGNIAALWIIATDMTAHRVGTVTGFMSLIGSLGAILAPALAGFIVEATGRWEYALYMTGLVNVMTFLVTGTLISTERLSGLPSSVTVRKVAFEDGD